MCMGAKLPYPCSGKSQVAAQYYQYMHMVKESLYIKLNRQMKMLTTLMSRETSFDIDMSSD